MAAAAGAAFGPINAIARAVVGYLAWATVHARRLVRACVH
jgi:hypothetical protein